MPRVIPFGKYLLLDRIAVGGMAEVYTAKSFGIEGFEKIIAIKRILPTMAEDRDFIAMFIDEAKIAGHLTHANIVPIYELGKIGDSHYIAMEYVWGKDLLQIMNRFRRMRRHMPPVMAAWIGSKILEGLDYAHRKRDRHGRAMGIIHRDVSPQNVLVSYEGQVKLIDFGIAKAASRNTRTQAGVLKGKFGYMSPEQVRGNQVDHRSDVFAASTCLHEMLTGERLFVGESDFSTLEKVRNADVLPPSQLVTEMPPELEQIVLKGLAREPEQRWQTASEMQEALQRFIAMQRPPFGTSKLNTWMRTAFAPEIAREKARLDTFAKIGHPGGGLPVAEARIPSLGSTSPQNPVAKKNGEVVAIEPPRGQLGRLSEEPDGADHELVGEATMISSSPFEALAEQENLEELAEQPTQIFFTADEMGFGDEETASAPAGSLSSNPPPSFHPAGVDPIAATRMPPPRPIGIPSEPPPNAASPPTFPQSAPGFPQSAPAFPQTAPAFPQTAPAYATSAPSFPQTAPAYPPAPPGAPSFPQTAPAYGQPYPPLPSSGGPTLPQPGASSASLDAALPIKAKRQREIKTVEMERGQNAAVPARGGIGRLVAVLSVIALLVVGASVAGGLYLFGTDRTGTISVRVEPASADARVFVDGVQRGRAPLRLEHVPAGQHTIEVRAEGHPSASRVVPVSAGSTAMLEIALDPPTIAPPPVIAPVPPTPTDPATPGATGVEAGQNGDTSEGDAPANPQPSSGTPAETSNETSRESDDEPARRRGRSHGYLLIQTMPWARVFVDGRDTGRNTPVPRLRVPPGPHTIGLRTNDGTMHNVPVTVRPGETTRIVRSF